jgi:hypothetical protein
MLQVNRLILLGADPTPPCAYPLDPPPCLHPIDPTHIRYVIPIFFGEEKMTALYLVRYGLESDDQTVVFHLKPELTSHSSLHLSHMYYIFTIYVMHFNLLSYEQIARQISPEV